ncbi:unnamed protein product [Triticum turgidum subsp. durum]|uniref:Uncharacterized protein n=1 Tax=Triticum turgidum subsp. durum TaxID=4567 RepID=A0A9R1BDX5_TRITD|nr:unnamed protein product [Triticum turgidum subsp. durum]
MHCTISKLSNGALESVANIVAHNGISFRKIRPTMMKIVKDHLPKYLAELDSESALAGLDEIPQQAAIAINRKLSGKSCPPEFLHVARTSSRSHLINLIRKRCGNMIAKLQEGNDLPENFAKALSVMNLYRKLTLKSMAISQSEFFPFPRATISSQQDILNALWSLPNVDTDDMKLLRRIMGQGSQVKMASFKAAVRRYLTECLFECDDGNLPDLAVRAIGFLAQMSPKCQQAILTEERKEVEVDAVLDLSSCLRSLVRGATEENSSDDEVSLESDRCSEDNDFVLTTSNYFDIRSEQRMDEGCCSNFMINSTEDPEYTAGAGHYGDSGAAGSTMDPSSEKDNVEMTRCSAEDLSALCDDTASIAHELIGHILKNMLTEDEGIDELTGCYLGGSSNSQDPQDPEAENQKGDIVINAVQSLLPNLPKSSIDKVRSILDGAEQ